MTNGVWKFAKLMKPPVKEEYRISLDEGDTPISTLRRLATQFDLDELLVKREDHNPGRSFKDRSMAYWISVLHQKGENNFTISSSGNAAISAAIYTQEIDVQLNIFISPKTPEEKLKRLFTHIRYHSRSSFQDGDVISTGNVTLHFSLRAKSDAIKYADKNDSYLLRSSRDDLAIEGYTTISQEVISSGHKVDAMFILCSSGASTVGIYEGFKRNRLPVPPIYIVQTTKIHPIAKEFDTSFETTEESLCNAVSDRVAARKKQIVSIVNETGGSGVVVDDNFLQKGQTMLRDQENIGVSYDGAATMAGFLKMDSLDFVHSKKPRYPLLIISGR